MSKHIFSICTFLVGLIFIFSMSGCSTKTAPITIDKGSAIPGTQVAKKGETLALSGTGIEVGQRLPDVNLVDAATMKTINLNDYQGSILFLSIVPSIDTKVCETQTHYLGEQGDTLPVSVKRITISRDTPFAQARFAKESKLEDLQYLSDYKEGEFGRSIGLLLEGPRLLARSVILIDKQGVVRYIQVVPDITHLPDMEEAFARATAMAKEP